MIILAWFDLINQICWIISSEESKINFPSLKFSLSKIFFSLKPFLSRSIFLFWSIYPWGISFNIFDLMKNLDSWLLGSVLVLTLIRPCIFRFDHPWSWSSHDLIWSCWFHQSRYWINRNVELYHMINSNCTSWILSLIFSLHLIFMKSMKKSWSYHFESDLIR